MMRQSSVAVGLWDSWDNLQRRGASGQARDRAARPAYNGDNAGRLAMERATQTFASDVQQLAGIRTFVRSACERAWGAGHEEIAHLELALAEAAANVMLHAYEGEPGRPIEVLVEAGPEEVRARVYPEGRGFCPGAVGPPGF